MPTATYDLIASNVLSSSASSVTFSSIPATYRDLVLVFNVIHQTFGYNNIFLSPNSSSSISGVVMGANGSSTFTSTFTGTQLDQSYGGGLTGNWAQYIIQFFDYSATDKHKTYLVRSGNPDGPSSPGTQALANRYESTSAITSLAVSSSASFRAGSTFYLYGIVS